MIGSVELESTAYLDVSSERPEFQIRMKRSLNPFRSYQVFGLEKGFLMLDMGYAGSNSQLDGNVSIAGGIIDGGIGRLIGNAIERASEVTMTDLESNFTRYSDSQLIEMAREQKGCLVANYDEITAVSIDAPSFMQALGRGASVAAFITVKEETLGKMTWEVCDVHSLHTTYEFLPAKLGDIVKVNAGFNPEKTRLVKRGKR